MEIIANLDEQYWIEEFRKGEELGLSYFFDLYHKSLLFFAGQMVQHSEEAEDIVSECFFKLWQRHEGFESPEKIKAFLYISCRNACLNFIKHQKVKTGVHEMYLKEFLSFGENTLSLMIKAEVLELIHQEIEQLPDKMQQIFKMMYFDGKNTNEIAVELNLSIQTVRNQKTKAIDILKIAALKKGLSTSLYGAFLAMLEIF